MSERQPEKRLETWPIEDRFKLVKALSKNEVWANFENFLKAQCDKDVAEYKPNCECQCNCKKCGRIGNNHSTLKLIGMFTVRTFICFLNLFGVSGPKEEKVLKVCEEIQGLQGEDAGFTINNLFKLLNENGHFDAMKTLKKYVPKKDYEKAFSHMPEGIDVEQLRIPNIPYEELDKCCNGYVNFLNKLLH